MSDRRLALLLASVLGCGDRAPHVVPSQIEVGERGPLRIEGLAPDDFLHATSGDELALALDYRAELGATSTTVIEGDASGVTVTTDDALAVGWHPLSLQANGTTWFVDNALEVVSGSVLPDGMPDGDVPGDVPDMPRVCPDAPDGCDAFRCASTTSCYYTCEAKTASAAAALCGARSIGCLVTIGDADENACIAAAAQPAFPDLVWIGYTQTDHDVEPAGGWEWRCATSTFVAPNWGMFEPNDGGGNEDCGAMGADGVWLDGGCTTELRYVCELP